MSKASELIDALQGAGCERGARVAQAAWDRGLSDQAMRDMVADADPAAGELARGIIGDGVDRSSLTPEQNFEEDLREAVLGPRAA